MGTGTSTFSISSGAPRQAQQLLPRFIDPRHDGTSSKLVGTKCNFTKKLPLHTSRLQWTFLANYWLGRIPTVSIYSARPSWGPRGPLKFRRPRPAISESYGWCNIVLCSGKNTVFKCSTYNKEGNSSVLDYLLKWVLTFLMSFFFISWTRWLLSCET